MSNNDDDDNKIYEYDIDKMMTQTMTELLYCGACIELGKLRVCELFGGRSMVRLPLQ